MEDEIKQLFLSKILTLLKLFYFRGLSLSDDFEYDFITDNATRRGTTMTAKTEAIANADAHTNDAGLPTYSDLLETIERLLALELPDVGCVRTARKQLDRATA